MCAGSKTTIQGEEVGVYMGYYGGSMQIGDIDYDTGDKDCSRKNMAQNRRKLIIRLNTFTSDDLSEMIVQLVENSEEG